MSWRTWLQGLFPKENLKHSRSVSPQSESVSLMQEKDARSEVVTYPLMVNAWPLYEWITTNASPYAWDRAVMRCLNKIIAEGLSLKSMLNPTPGMVVSGETIQALVMTVEQLYGLRVPGEVIAPVSE
ncbi:MAG: hypothetical protein RML92_09245 [Bacteroidia bacterium]|nr:hypothetical protein [Bacteroidia bacterium]MDW8417719.1 hypothetical protein [Bacteroidia bacterium]